MAMTDVGVVLTERIKALPDRGLEAIKQFLRNAGRGPIADTLVSVYDTSLTSGTLLVQLQSFEFTDLSRADNPPMLNSRTFINETSVPQEQTFSYTYTHEREFKFGFSEGLTVGTKVEATAKVPLVGSGAKVEISASFSFSAEQSWSYKTSTQVSDGVRLTIPPMSTVLATSASSYGSSTAKFTARALATNGSFMCVCFQRNFNVPTFAISIPVYNLLDQNGRTVQVSGTMSGANFLDTVVTTKEESLGRGEGVAISLIPAPSNAAGPQSADLPPRTRDGRSTAQLPAIL